MAKLIFGCGYLGRRAARRWQAIGEQVFAVTRSVDRADQLRAEGLLPVTADVTQPESLRNLPAADTVLYAVGFDRAAGKSIEEVYVDGLAAVLAALSPDTRRLIYISSTGVYGQSAGEWIDETSPCEPTREAGRACLAAEHLLADHALGDRTIVLRLAGIYGPGRLPRMANLQAGEPIPSEEDGYLNLIHVDDAAAIVLAAESRSSAPRTFTVSDGSPVVRRAFYEELARLIASPAPRFAPAEPSAKTSSRGGSNKRVRNTRMLAELNARLAYPSYREGLAAITADEPGPSDHSSRSS